MLGIEVSNEKIILKECPIGLFTSMDNELCLKTEYGVDSYIVSSGEKFWGGAKSQDELEKVLVFPCSIVNNVVKVGCINKVYTRDNVDIENVIKDFNLNFVHKSDRTIIYENEDCRFSFDKSVIRVLIYDGLNNELSKEIDNYFYGK